MSCRCRFFALTALGLLLAGPGPAPGLGAEQPDAWPLGAEFPAWDGIGKGPGQARPAVEPVAEEHARQWLRWVVPLPKRVRLEGKLVLPAGQVSVRLRRGATDVERTAADELLSLAAAKTGTKEFAGEFPILAGVCDGDGKIDGTPIPGADRLRALKNSDQAYLIAPLPGRGIAVAALTDRGVYYGLKTLSQLLEPYLAEGRVTLPRAAVLDWPDLAERGQWGGSANRDVQYLADRKMNLVESHSEFSIDEQGRGKARIDAQRQQAARLRAIKWVPIVTHLDQLHRTGIFERFPELKGKGPKAGQEGDWRTTAPCFSQPKTAELLADWFLSLAEIEGVRDVNVWLSESHVQCGCETCQARGQFALEAAACVRAWEIARRKRPDVRLRILLTQGSYATNDKVLAAASPPEVGITYYDGGRTYDSSRDEMIYPLLADFAAQGRWLGCYPQLTASWRIVCPWSAPQFIKFRMTEFVDKGLECLCGYATPDNRYYDFNVTAAAEWSWNARGRDEREMAASWATRKGLRDPEKAADWAVMLGPVGWDVYGSGIPYPWFFNRAANAIKARNRPEPGKTMFRYFPTAEHVERNLAVCDEAMKLAEALGDPAVLAETRVIRGYVRMVKSIHAIGTAAAGKKELDEAGTKAVQAAKDELTAAAEETARNLEAWRQAVAPDDRAPRFADTVDVTRRTAADVAASLAPLGVK